MPAVGPGATRPTFHHRRSTDWAAAGPRWALTWPICLEQSTMSRAPQSDQAQSAQLTILEKLTQDQSEVQVQGHKCAIPRDRGGREAKSLRRSVRDALSISPTFPQTGRQDRTS